jgi:hypothetical protein
MGGRRQRGWPWALLAGMGAGGALACQGGAFACTSDEQCVDGSASGICQPTGWCSFEDPECPSMQRYAEHSASGLAGTYVPEAGEGSSSGPTASSDGTTGAGPTSTEAGDDPSLDDTTETGVTSLPPLDTGKGESSSGDEPGTTGEPEVCEVVLFDDFEDGMIDPQWDPWADGGTSLQEIGSALRFSIVGDVLAGDDAGVLSVARFDLVEGYVRLEITEVPTPDTAMQLYWQLVTDTCTVQGLVDGGLVYAFDEVFELGETAWLQMRFEQGLGYLDRSIDGLTWEPVIDSAPLFGCEPIGAQVYVFGGAGMPSALRAAAAVGTVEACGAVSD